MALTDRLTAIANAIREKTGTTDRITLDRMPEMISAISGGSVEEFVNFYDYDGTLLRQYPLSQFAKLSYMPALPNSLPGCECTGWNYDMDTIKEMNCHVNVAAVYKQLEGEEPEVEETEPVYADGTKLWLHIDHDITVDFTFKQTKSHGVTVHWGDGATSVSNTTTGSNRIVLSHAYTAGDYVMTFDIAEGCLLTLGFDASYSVMGYCQVNGTYLPKLQTLERAEIDLRNTNLAVGAFRYCTDLVEVTFGDGTHCGLPSQVFEACYRLETVRLSHSITSVGSYAFRYCSRLLTLEIPSSVTALEQYAFAECRRLHHMDIPGTVKSLGNYCFQNCTGLIRITLGYGIKTIGSYAFASCMYLRQANLPESITSIGDAIFSSCFALKSAVWPSGVPGVKGSSFASCYSLQTVVLPEGVTTISSSAFSTCHSLRFVGLPKTCTSMGDNAFLNCSSLKNIVFPNGFLSIGSKACSSCYSLEYIILPPTVTSSGYDAFQNCRMLKNFIVPETLYNNTALLANCQIQSPKMVELAMATLARATVIRESAYELSALTEVLAPSGVTSVGTNAFKQAHHLRKVSLAMGVTSIGENAFQSNYSLRECTLPNSITSIGNSAFSGNCNLGTIELPSSMTSLGSSAFAMCYNLERVVFRGGSPTVGGSAFNQCYNLKELSFPGGGHPVYSSCFHYCGFERFPEFPYGTSFQGTQNFQYCHALQNADLRRTITGTSDALNSGFLYCYALKEAFLSDYSSRVPTSMFQYCFALGDKITIPKATYSIDSNAFYECRNLREVEFNGSDLTTIGGSSFYNCYALREFRIPYSVKTMSQCFQGCYGLHRIYAYPLTAPTGTTTIGALAGDYVIYVPKGSLASYEAQWTGHTGHFREFEYVASKVNHFRRTIGTNDNEIILRNAFMHSALEEEHTISVALAYNGTNLKNFTTPVYDAEAETVRFSFEREEDFDYSAEDTITFTVTVDGTDLDCDFDLELKYTSEEVSANYEVCHISGYRFALVDGDYYKSQNAGVHSSYALCKIVFTTNTGKLYLDCIGGGEANFDYGIVSNIDCTLAANANGDTGSNVKKSFYGMGSYDQTLEFDVEDSGEHFIFVKYRKDGSVNSGLDSIKFRVRFED